MCTNQTILGYSQPINFLYVWGLKELKVTRFPPQRRENRSKIPIWAVDIVHKIGMILRPTPVAAKNDPMNVWARFLYNCILDPWKHAKTVSKHNLKLMPANRMNHSVLHWMFMLTTQSPKLTRHQVHYNYAQHHVSEDKNQWACNGRDPYLMYTSANRQPFRASRNRLKMMPQNRRNALLNGSMMKPLQNSLGSPPKKIIKKYHV